MWISASHITCIARQFSMPPLKKHILCEKPLPELKEAGEITAAIKKENGNWFHERLPPAVRSDRSKSQTKQLDRVVDRKGFLYPDAWIVSI
ncbi:MAG: hypothetical protein IPI28_19345 [Candidatus Omnitrophica bacterium]|nr:hypothetical protein [Candidatus Omnitrophota bacterium]